MDFSFDPSKVEVVGYGRLDVILQHFDSIHILIDGLYNGQSPAETLYEWDKNRTNPSPSKCVTFRSLE